MKIALLAPLRFPVGQPYAGGVEMHSHLLAKELRTRGHTVTLFAHPKSDESFGLVPCSLSEGAGFGATTFAYRRVMKELARGDFDLVHNNSLHFLPPLLTGTLPFPMVTTLHTPPYRSFRLTAALTRRTASHQYVSISRFIQSQWSGLIGKSTVIHNGIPLSEWPYSPVAVPRTAVWFGRFTPEKGAEYAIEAAQRAGYRLTLAGPVYDQPYFDQKVAPRLNEQITYAGHLNQPELASLVGRSSVGLVTSVWDEPFGLAYVEMAACGTPVAAFDSGAAREIIREQCGALVAKRDVAALAQVLGELKSRERSGCRQYIETHFPVSRMVEGYLAVYEGAITGK